MDAPHSEVIESAAAMTRYELVQRKLCLSCHINNSKQPGRFLLRCGLNSRGAGPL
jgi:hypothetical protein